MISSTQTDLQPERSAADEVVRSLHYEPLRAETYDARGLSPEEICLRMVEECDLYICILGFRYGSIPDSLRISVTEMEYQRARQIDPGKILIYLKREDEHHIVDRRQRRFREQVEDFSLGYFRHSKFLDLDDLQIQIRRDMAAWITDMVSRVRVERTLRIAAETELVAARANVELFKQGYLQR